MAINYLRNVGISAVRTPFTLMMDVDLVPSPNMHGYLKNMLRTERGNDSVVGTGLLLLCAWLGGPTNLMLTCCRDLFLKILSWVEHLNIDSAKIIEKYLSMNQYIETHFIFLKSKFSGRKTILCIRKRLRPQ